MIDLDPAATGLDDVDVGVDPTSLHAADNATELSRLIAREHSHRRPSAALCTRTRTHTARRLRCESAGSCSPLTAKPATSLTDHGSSRAQMYAYDARLPIAMYNGGRLSTSLVTLLTAGPEQAGTATSYRAADQH